MKILIIEKLIREANIGMLNSYLSTSSERLYGAAVLTKNGNMYSSGVYKSETRSLTVHAEQAALIHAAAHGENDIVAIAIVSNEDAGGKNYTNPCGMCKQILYENYLHSGSPMKVILTTQQGRYKLVNLTDLIIFPWPPKHKKRD